MWAREGDNKRFLQGGACFPPTGADELGDRTTGERGVKGKGKQQHTTPLELE